jgi:hypothetical protein
MKTKAHKMLFKNAEKRKINENNEKEDDMYRG